MSFLPTGDIEATEIFSNASGGTTTGSLTGLVGCNYYDANYRERTVASPSLAVPISISSFRGMIFTKSLVNNTDYFLPTTGVYPTNEGTESFGPHWMITSNYNNRFSMSITGLKSISAGFSMRTDSPSRIQQYDISIDYNTTTNSTYQNVYSNYLYGNAGLPIESTWNVSGSNIKNVAIYLAGVGVNDDGNNGVVTMYTVYRFVKGDPYTVTYDRIYSYPPGYAGVGWRPPIPQ